MKNLKNASIDNVLLMMIVNYFTTNVKTVQEWWKAVKAFEHFFLSSTVGSVPKGDTFAGGKLRFLLEMSAEAAVKMNLMPADGQRELEEKGVAKFAKTFRKSRNGFLVPILVTNDDIRMADGYHRYEAMKRVIKANPELGSKKVLILFGDFTYDNIRELNDNQNGWKKKHHFQHGKKAQIKVIKDGYEKLDNLKNSYPYVNYNELMMIMYKTTFQAFDDQSKDKFRDGEVYWGQPSVHQLTKLDENGQPTKLPVDPHETFENAVAICETIGSFDTFKGNSIDHTFTKSNKQYNITIKRGSDPQTRRIVSRLPYMDRYFQRAWLLLRSDEHYDHNLMVMFLTNKSFRTKDFIAQMADAALKAKDPQFFEKMKNFYNDSARENQKNVLTVEFNLNPKAQASIADKAAKNAFGKKRPDTVV